MFAVFEAEPVNKVWKLNHAYECYPLQKYSPRSAGIPLSEEQADGPEPACRLFYADFLPILPPVEAMIGVGETIDSEILDKLPNLRVISTISVGYDNFNVTDLTERGISLMPTPDVITNT